MYTKEHMAFSFFMLHMTHHTIEHQKLLIECNIIHLASSNFSQSCFKGWDSSGIESNRGFLRSLAFGKETPVPVSYFLPSDAAYRFLPQKRWPYRKDYPRSPRLTCISKAFSLAPSEFFIPWGWNIKIHQVRKIRLSQLVKLLELTSAEDKIYTPEKWKQQEWFPGATNTTGFLIVRGRYVWNRLCS